MSKQCQQCKAIKEPLEFSRNKTKPDGLCGRCKLCDKTKAKIYYHSHKHNRNNSNRKYLLGKYNITEDDYYAMLKIQEEKCAICSMHQSELSHKLSVDHNHSNGKVRGLLCHSCNLLLGKARDSVAILTKSINYLEKQGV